MLVTFVPVSVIGSGYAGKSGVDTLYPGIVIKAVEAGRITWNSLREAEEKAYQEFQKAGNFPGYIPTLKRVDIDVRETACYAAGVAAGFIK